MTSVFGHNVKRLLAVAVAVSGLSSMAALPNWPPPELPPMPPTACSDYCYNVDITNNTTFAANDLHVTLWGPTSICDHYTGSLNPFGRPSMVAQDGRLELHFASSSAYVNPNDIAHIGFCTNSPVTGMVTGHTNAGLPPFYWTRQRRPIGDIIAVGHSWEVTRANGGLSPLINVINTTPRPIKVRQVDWAVVQQPIPLEHLMWTELEGALEWQPLLKGAVLEGGSEDAPGYLRMPVPFSFAPGDARHIVFRVWAEDPKDPKNMNRGLGQASLSALSEQER